MECAESEEFPSKVGVFGAGTAVTGDETATEGVVVISTFDRVGTTGLLFVRPSPLARRVRRSDSMLASLVSRASILRSLRKTCQSAGRVSRPPHIAHY